MHDVVIAGAGPTGLMLACELKLGGIAPIVLERDALPTGLAKALGVSGRTLDLLDHRGLLERFEEAAARSPSIQGGALSRFFHFGGVPLDASQLPGPPPRFLPLFQSDTERLLADHARGLGIDMRRGHSVIGLDQSEESVRLTVESRAGRQVIDAQYVVGCDGAHSDVRKLSGIAFPGTEPSEFLRLGDIKLPPELSAPGSLWVTGRAPIVPLAGGWARIITKEPVPAGFDRSTPMTLAELRDSVRRVFQLELPEVEVRSLARFTDTSRLADEYRRGRVLLAGDAAHVHLPAGGPGLNAGLNDAFNLGWKLASQLRGDAPPGLLDTYHAERHPVGKRLMMHTRAQGAMLHATLESLALRELVGGLLRHPPVLRDLVDMLQGTDVRYDVGDNHPLSGAWVPDLDVGGRHVSGLMHSARGVLLDFGGGQTFSKIVAAYRIRVDYVRVEMTKAPAVALLIRPDGHVAWATSNVGNGDGLERALTRWFTRVPSTSGS